MPQRRFCRRPCRRPFQGTAGPATAAPPGATTAPASRSCTYVRSAGFAANFARFGRRAARSACHRAAVARYSRAPPRVAALRRSSREIVEAARPRRRATSRTPEPCARHSAISSRSANDRLRPDGGSDDGDRCEGAIPPAWRNHRNPTGCETPTFIAASSLDNPAAMNAQNRRRCSCRASGGRPGDLSSLRNARSERRLRVPIANPSVEALRRPLESALHTPVAMVDQPRRRLPPLQAHPQGVARQLGPEVVGHRPADDLARGHVLDRGQVQPALAGRDVGEVGQPDRVRSLGGELPVEQVGRDREVVAAVGGPRDAAPPARDGEAALAHEPRHPLAADPDALRPQLGVHARAAVGAPAGLEDRRDPLAHPSVIAPAPAPAPARSAAEPGVEAAHRDAHDPAQRPDRERRTLGGDEALPHETAASLAKKAAAFLRISFSCSSRFTSRRSRASSAASAFCRARASAVPAARCSLRQRLRWLAGPPSPWAPACRVLPLAASRLTASLSYSAVNRRRFLVPIPRSRCWWAPPYGGVHPAGAGSARRE